MANFLCVSYVTGIDQAEFYENFDLESIVTPVKIEKFRGSLEEACYPRDEINFIRNGFTHGFDIGYQGPQIRQSGANNIPLKIGNKVELWNKLMKEVRLRRVAGPFDRIPFENYIQSPIGLVPKVGGNTRLIFHLSYDFDEKDEKFLNHYTPKELCPVSYRDIDHAVKAYLCMKDKNTHEKGGTDNVSKEPRKTRVVFGGKTDVQSAFRLVPLKKQYWKWLVMKAQNPVVGQWQFFIDKCLPFGTSISCAVFQRISDAIKYLIEHRTDTIFEITNYLDDFLFLVLTLAKCNGLIKEFLDLCNMIGIPIADDKTVWANELVVFLGVLLDGKHFMIRLLLEKRVKVVNMIKLMLSKNKAKVGELQELCGYLNFLCKVIFPGCPFIRRMYAKYSKNITLPGFNKREVGSNATRVQLKSYQHVGLDAEFKADCQIWLQFLDQQESWVEVVNRPMIDILSPDITLTDINFYSDASALSKLGFGCLLDSKWLRGDWDPEFIKKYEPSIEYLELFALCAGIFTWGEFLKNTRITVFCDNTAVVAMIKNMTSSCKNCMMLIRMLTLQGLKFNRRLRAKYVSTKQNFLVDSLSRGQIHRFSRLGPHMDINPWMIHDDLWPMMKIWLHG